MPTIPTSLSLAAAIPATCDPCPLSSFPLEVPLINVTSLYTLRSGWSKSTPVSKTATSTLEAKEDMLVITAAGRTDTFHNLLLENWRL